MFVLDGELVISVDGALSFDALQMRLHPAESRIKRLSHETPATFIVFDCLLLKARQPLLTKNFEKRRAALEAFFKSIGEHEGMALTPFTRDLRGAKKWLTGREVSVDGVVSKRLDQPYQPGERAMLKVKCLRSADCVVGASAMRPAAAWSDRCCSASMTMRGFSTMSASPPPLRITKSQP
jgi:ATP-dependent DNA ligase